MLLAILIGNGIRLQSTITLCHEKFFSCRILQDTKVVCPFRENPPSTKVVCPFRENPPSTKVVCPHLCSKRIGRYVIIHDVNSRQDGVESVGMLRVRPSQEKINNSIRPNNSCGCQNAERFPCYNFTTNQINLAVAFRLREYYVQLNHNNYY